MSETRYTRSASFGTTGLWGCTDCGAAVFDREVHDRWHGQVVLDPWAGFKPMDLRVTESFDSMGHRTVVVTHLPTGVGARGDGRTRYEAQRACSLMLASRLAEYRERNPA